MRPHTILDSHLQRGHLEYLVQWKGFPHKEQEWKTTAELNHAKEAVADFHHLHPASPCPMPTIKLCFCCLENFTAPYPIPHYLFNWEDGTFEHDEHQCNNSHEEEEWFNALEQQP